MAEAGVHTLPRVQRVVLVGNRISLGNPTVKPDGTVVRTVNVPGAQVQVTLEIEAVAPEGIPENVVRTVTENARTLKFKSHGFETA